MSLFLAPPHTFFLNPAVFFVLPLPANSSPITLVSTDWRARQQRAANADEHLLWSLLSVVQQTGKENNGFLLCAPSPPHPPVHPLFHLAAVLRIITYGPLVWAHGSQSSHCFFPKDVTVLWSWHCWLPASNAEPESANKSQAFPEIAPVQ